MKIGVLDIQGSVEEHMEALKKLVKESEGAEKAILPGSDSRFRKKDRRRVREKIEPVLVKSLADLKVVSGLIIPGGESTTIGKLLRRFGLRGQIIRRVKNGSLSVWGTCAGAILLAKKIDGKQNTDSLGLMDIVVERNAYGSQIDSFETSLEFNLGPAANWIGHSIIPGIFIRAPKILAVGRGVQVLAKNKNEIVAVRQKNIMATNFHPELSENLLVHQYFLRMCRDLL